MLHHTVQNYAQQIPTSEHIRALGFSYNSTNECLINRKKKFQQNFQRPNDHSIFRTRSFFVIIETPASTPHLELVLIASITDFSSLPASSRHSK